MVLNKTKDIKKYGGKRFQLQAIETTKNGAKKFANMLQKRKGTKFNTRITRIPKTQRDKRGGWAVYASRK